MGEAQQRDVGGRTVARGSTNEARVVELCLIVLLLLTIAAVLTGRIGFTGEWGTVRGVGHTGSAMRPAFRLPTFHYHAGDKSSAVARPVRDRGAR